MRLFEELLDESVSLHGHLCPGQVLGVRMAMLGCELVGIDEPTETRDLVVYVEIDRCATDAIQAVTGCKLGKRTLKYKDYGKLAATFLDLSTGKAYRVAARDDSREGAHRYAPEDSDDKTAQIYAYQIMPFDELFNVVPVVVRVPERDMPGHPLSRVTCSGCDEGVNDRREVVIDGRTLCRSCAEGPYYARMTEQSLTAGNLNGHSTRRSDDHTDGGRSWVLGQRKDQGSVITHQDSDGRRLQGRRGQTLPARSRR